MLKKFITGLLALTLMTGMAGTITSFADDVEGSEGTTTRIEKSREGKKADREAQREETLNTMYPEILETNAALRADLETSKDEVKSIKEQIYAIAGVDKEANKAEHMAFIESLKAQLEAEEITREEAKKLFDDYREAQKTANEDIFKMTDENKAKLEEIRTQFQSFKEERRTIAKELKEAVANEDSAAFKVVFDKSIAILERTLSLENQKNEVLTDVLSNLQ